MSRFVMKGRGSQEGCRRSVVPPQPRRLREHPRAQRSVHPAHQRCCGGLSSQ